MSAKRDGEWVRGRWITLVGICALMAACSEKLDSIVEQEEPVAFAVNGEALYPLSTALWSGNIPVCWETAGNDTEKGWVRDAVLAAWGKNTESGVNFMYWNLCSAGSTGIRIRTADEWPHTVNIGTTINGTVNGMVLNFWFNFFDWHNGVWGQHFAVCQGAAREGCIRNIAVHEFGHALGFAHEQNRTDTPATCTQDPQGPNGDTFVGVWDATSTMNYCQPNNNNGVLSQGDSDGLRRTYGFPFPSSGTPGFCTGDAEIVIGDFNGDGRNDELCHARASGQKWIDYASSDGSFNGADWTGPVNGWCTGPNALLLSGDFNGDSRTDLFCQDRQTGFKWIDYADANGQFGGTDYHAAFNWCNHAGAQLVVGKFNADPYADLLCHDRNTGVKWIDYADAAGRLSGTDVYHSHSWCGHATGQLSVADFNGDGRSDLLCHDTADGRKWIDLSDSYGQFTGTNTQRTDNFCAHAGSRLLTGDFNGDTYADIICHDTLNGRKWIRFSNSAGQLTDGVWSGPFRNYCSAAGQQLFIAKLNNDGRSDLLCHDFNTGRRYVQYPTQFVQNGNEWISQKGFALPQPPPNWP